MVDNSETVINAENVSKRYRIGLAEQNNDTFAGQVINVIKSPVKNFKRLRRLKQFSNDDESVNWALRDINFTVEKGEVLGIIGHNGAGKSTLLKILSHITEPTTGLIRIKGRISALLEVGTGFHVELTGRDNVYMNGTILGMTKREIDAKFDEIVDFSGVERYIDTPVKFYSSGMKVRLGFSVAAHLDPEILIIDEVLAVGDMAFQKKSLDKMEDVSKSGRTVLFVSHNMSMVRKLCDRAICLSNGQQIFNGNVEEGIRQYQEQSLMSNEFNSSFYPSKDESLPLYLNYAKLLNGSNELCNSFEMFEDIYLEISYTVARKISGTIVNFYIMDGEQTIFASFDSDLNHELLNQREPGDYTARAKLPNGLLKEGKYRISCGTGIANTQSLQQFDGCLGFSIYMLEMEESFVSFSPRRAGVVAQQIEWNLISS